MSFSLKAFLLVGGLINNTPGQTAKFGELSTIGYTYSKQQNSYFSAAFPDRALVSFSSKVNDAAAALPSGYSAHIHRVLDKLLAKAATQNTAEYSRAELLAELVIEIGNEAIEFDCGLIVTDGVRWLPEWIGWKATGLPEASNRITVWLSDEAFRSQYPDYEITVIPPLANLDTFFQPVAQVRQALAAVVADEQMDLVEAAKQGYPETAIRAMTFKYVDPQNATTKIDTVWTLLIYGSAGDNPDSIKQALFDYILSHSTRTQAQWEVIFPDIFRTTEFLVLPLWSKLALPQLLPIAAIYSGFVTLGADVTLLKNWVTAKFPEYTTQQVNRSMSSLTHNYRSLAVVFVGAQKNRDNKWLITDWFPDYIPVPSTAVDFSRMSQPTAQWALLLSTALMLAETWSSSTILPANIRRLNRNGVDMLVFTHLNINYLIYPRNAPVYSA